MGVPESASSWTIRQGLEALLDQEYQAFRRKFGCEVGDNFEASKGILEAIQYLRNTDGENDNEEE